MRNNIILALVSFLIGGLIFFFVGRSTSKTETIVEYVKGDPVIGSVNSTQLKPISEITPEKPKYPIKQVENKVIIDTAAIIAEYEKIRNYSVVAFDNKEQGKLTLFPKLQYNTLASLDYEFTPIQKQVTIYKTKVVQPFASISYSTLNYINIGGGVFYHNLGFEYQFQKSLGNLGDGHTIGLKYKF